MPCAAPAPAPLGKKNRATGSACANLGGWFLALRPGGDVSRRVSQGDEVHRPSTLFLAVKSGAVSVGGDVAELARGTLDL